MTINQEFDDFFGFLIDRFQHLNNDDVAETNKNTPTSNVGLPTGMKMCENGRHILQEVGSRQEMVDFTNKYDVPMRGFRVYAKTKCLRCPFEGEYLKI